MTDSTNSFSLERLREGKKRYAAAVDPTWATADDLASWQAWREEYAHEVIEFALALADRLQEADAALRYWRGGPDQPREEDALNWTLDALERHASRPREQREG